MFCPLTEDKEKNGTATSKNQSCLRWNRHHHTCVDYLDKSSIRTPFHTSSPAELRTAGTKTTLIPARTDR